VPPPLRRWRVAVAAVQGTTRVATIVVMARFVSGL
jgi:hypothetical protein